ncbi:MAG: hypothetical protein WC897_04915 [Candidatus Gracilibacteria bacterium]
MNHFFKSQLCGFLVVLALTGCAGLGNKSVDAYQMVWELDISPVADIIENEEDKELFLNEFQKQLEDKADEYADYHNVYIKEEKGQYFAFIELPATGVDKEKMQLEEGGEKPLEFVIMGVEYTNVETDEWIKTDLDESHLVSADVQFNAYYQPYVSLTFDEEGAKLFEEITEQAIGKRLGIFVYGELIAAPTVSEKISGGQAQISTDFTIEEAQSLSEDLMSGVGSSIRLIEINEIRVSF